MTIRAVTVPKWGLEMREGQIVHLYIEVGLKVAAGDPLADIETPKITNTLESDYSGVIRRVLASVGQSLLCGQLIAVIDDADASDSEIEAFVANARSSVDLDASGAPSNVSPIIERVTVNGRDIGVLKMGEGAQVPVVFLHGFGGDANNWMFTQPDIAKSRSTLAFDLPGHGASSKDVGDGSIETLAELVAAAFTTLGLERVHLVGHSLGGAVAIAAALARPQAVVSVSLICSAGLGHEINGTYLAGFLGAKRRRDLQKVLGALFSDEALANADMAEQILRGRRLDGAEAALALIAGANFGGGRQETVLADKLAATSIARSVIWGREDQIIPSFHATRIGGTPHIIERAGHMPHLERSTEVNTLLRSFIESVNVDVQALESIDT